jgi:hypothetical protein
MDLSILFLASCLIGADPTPAPEVDSLGYRVLDHMETIWADLTDYTCTLHSFIKLGDEVEDRTYEYRFMKPGWVYMKIVEGKDKGARVRFNPSTQKVLGAKGGFISFIKKSFDVDDPTVRSMRGHRVTESNWGLFVERGRRYLEEGTFELLERDTLDGLETFLIELTVEEPLDEQDVMKEFWWVSVQDTLPVQFEEYDPEGNLARRIRIFDLEFDRSLTEDDFGI